jgi:hypothetical protein
LPDIRKVAATKLERRHNLVASRAMLIATEVMDKV